MTVELRSNGKTSIELIPETEIQKAFVQAFIEAGTAGRIASITSHSESGVTSVVLSV